MLNRLADHYGWRGLWLMLLGSTWIAFGIGVLLEPTQPRSWVLYEHAPILLQAAVWWGSGAIAVWQGWRGPGRDDAWGHVALYLMPAVRVVCFALAWLIYVATSALDGYGLADVAVGYPQGWYAALLWSLVSLMLAIGARWPNPAPPLPQPPTTAAGDA